VPRVPALFDDAP